MEIAGAALLFVGKLVFVLVLLAGVLLTLVGLPGTVLVLLAALVWSALTGWSLPGWLLLVLLGIGVVAEVSDNLISALGVKKYGGSTRGMAWAMVGGLLGAFVLGAALGPLLGPAGAVIMPIVGGLAGGFAGGYWYERRQGRSAEEAKRAGLGAMMGRVAGMFLKAGLAAVMVVVVLLNAF